MENKSDTYSVNLNKLLRFFERTDGGYAFASTKVQSHITLVNNELRKLLKEDSKKIVFVYFDSKSELTLFEQLRQQIKNDTKCLVVNNITELLFPMSESEASQNDALQELNFLREKLYNLKVPILFWLTDDYVSIFSNRAVDLYSQRSISTVYFDNIPDEDISNQEIESSFQPKHRSSKSNQETELKVDLLKKQLREAEKGKHHLSDIANRLVMPLAKIYSKLDLHSKSLNLINKYEDYINRKNLQILLTLAKILKKANMLEEAVSHYEEAISLAKMENNIKDEALSKFYIASIYLEKGQMEDALLYFKEYNDLFKKLYNENPANDAIKNSLAISYSKVGDIYLEMGKYKEALEYFEKECELFSQLYKNSPSSENVKNGLAISYSKVAYAYQNIGDYNKAIHYIELDIELTTQLGESENTKSALAVSYERLGDIYMAMEQYEKALHFFKLRAEIAQELNEKHPDNKLYIEGFAISNYKLATIYKRLNSMDESQRYFIEWQKFVKSLNKDFPDSAKYQSWKSLDY